MVAEFLTREGLEIEPAEDAAATDAPMARRRPDLVVLDQMMPGEDGLSLCRRPRSDCGPEFVAEPLQDWLRRAGIEPIRIVPGSPWENG